MMVHRPVTIINKSVNGKMELVSKPNATAAVREPLGFKPNDRVEPLKLDKPVCRICCKTVATKSGNTTNMHLHLKSNHPMQFSQLGKKLQPKLHRGRLHLADSP